MSVFSSLRDGWFGFGVCPDTFTSGQCVLTSAMKGGSVRFVIIESKSFDLRVVGSKDDILKISEQGRGRSFSIFLPEPVAQWLLRAWGRFRLSKSSTWRNQMRLSSRLLC